MRVRAFSKDRRMAKFIGGLNLIREGSPEEPTDFLVHIIKTKILKSINSFQPDVVFHVEISYVQVKETLHMM